MPWLPGYFNAIKSAAAEFGPSHIALSKITKVIEIIPGLFSHNHTVLTLYALLAFLGAVLTDKRIVVTTLAWGLTPGLLIAINGHPLYIRHLVTLAACILLLSAFALAKMGEMIGHIIGKSNPIQAIAAVFLGFFVAFSTNTLSRESKEKHYAAETAPYKDQVLTACLNYPNADYAFTRNYDVFTNTILRWYLGDIFDVKYSKQQSGNKNVLLFKQDQSNANDTTPFFKRMPEMAGMHGFIISGLQLKDTSPITTDRDNESYTIDYNFSSYKVLADAISWKNVFIDPSNNTLEPASRLEMAEIIFEFRLPKSNKLHFTATLQGSKEAGTDDTLEFFASSDNTVYSSLSKTNNPEAFDKRFTQTYTFDSNSPPQQFYVKLVIKPGMTVACATLNALKFTLNNGDAAPSPFLNGKNEGSSPSDPAAPLASEADFGKIDNPNVGYTLSGNGETMRIIAPVFDKDFDLEKDLFLKSNLRIKQDEGCLTCASEGPCQFVYYLHSEKPIDSTNLIFYPRIFHDKDKKNHVSVSYSYDGKTFYPLWTTQNNSNLVWNGQRKRLSIPLKKKLPDLFVRFELYSEGSQLQSIGNRAMYVVTQSPSEAISSKKQDAYFQTVKRLLGL